MASIAPTLALKGAPGCCSKNEKGAHVVYDSTDKSFMVEKCTCRLSCCSSVPAEPETTWQMVKQALQ